RNLWSWGLGARRPRLWAAAAPPGPSAIDLDHEYYGTYRLHADGAPELLFTENETNFERLWGVPNESSWVKDAFHDYVVRGARDAVNPARRGSKAAARYLLAIPAGESVTVRLRLTADLAASDPFGAGYEEVFRRRLEEADGFYAGMAPADVSEDAVRVQRQAAAGLLWSKQFYHYDVARWLKGDPDGPPPPAERQQGRNHEWTHLYNADVISMPDKWEYPWFAAWDLAFHCVTLAIVDPHFAKQQLVLLLREWYMHPNGQLPAYEWAFGDVNPPVHAWAAWRVYKIERKRRGRADRNFLERVFHKLLLNFTWWVNRKDAAGNNIFQGGFLGLDNIGVFDRSAPLPTGGSIEQSDGTSWMGMFCLNMLAIALELAEKDPAYEDVASKFFEHFVYICRAMNDIGGRGIELWDSRDGFFYDVLHLPDGRQFPLKVRSMVGLIPLFAVETLESDVVDRLPGFKRRMQWFLENRAELGDYIETRSDADLGVRRFLALVNRTRLLSVLRYMLDESEFLSPYGVRALSRYHKDHPYVLTVGGQEYRVDYEPAESRSGAFGGNSNWRGPVWFPVNYLIIESLQKFHYFLGDSFQVEFPAGSGMKQSLWGVAGELSRRLSRLFLRGADGRRPVFGANEKFQSDPHFRDLIPFYEYFHGDNGEGLGASHQTGWTGLVAKLIQQSGD
ncbi:MAG TPA: glucosidase, partial [Thermoanaerobaculia bacterium]|nr:glucosidase [Thermoanaerobaculia bacterium]